MRFLRPAGLAEACEMKATEPDLVPLAGGTDVMVEFNFGRDKPHGLLDLSRVGELQECARDGAMLRLGAGMTYTRMMDELAASAPALAMAARTVGSLQIRNRGTLGGNLATASPAGDGLPPLVATGADVELASVRATRVVPIDAFFTGPKRTVLAPDELITAVHVPARAGPQQFAKVGTRNAMVIAVATVATALDASRRRVGVSLGAVAPTPVRAALAEDFASDAFDWSGGTPLDGDAAARFGALAADAAAPIDDVRGTARYRKHAIAVLTARCLTRSWEEYRRSVI
ncbi:FAD binding domain-containing protein [Streptomyces sp. 3N207]|uniref:FAD binding domain-containing protein n=1 Tax=Streptomyces sp. 3N207 TaxID=3457417 RepID=UPI003FD30E76